MTKQYQTVFMSAGLSEQPLLFSSTTGPNRFKRLTQTQQQWDSDQTNVQLLCQPSLVDLCIFRNTHSSVHSFVHLRDKWIIYIPFQRHCFDASSHTMIIATKKINPSRQDETHTHEEKKKSQTNHTSHHPLRFFKSAPFLLPPTSSSVFSWSLMMKMKSEWSWVFFGWLSPSRVLSAGIWDKSPSPSARISFSAPGQSRNASHSAGYPLCDLWCKNPDLPAGEKNKSGWLATLRSSFEESEGFLFIALELLYSLTSLQDWIAMYSAKIFLDFEAILDCDLIFLYSSHASQNSRFSSLNSVRRKALNAARPSERQKERKKKGES